MEKGRLNKVTFSKEVRYILLQESRLHDANKAPHGKKDEYFTKFLHTFIPYIPTVAWETVQTTTMNTMKGKIRSMMVERRETKTRSLKSSVISEEVGPVDHLLDYFLRKLQESEEENRKERGESTATEDAFLHPESKLNATLCHAGTLLLMMEEETLVRLFDRGAELNIWVHGTKLWSAS